MWENNNFIVNDIPEPYKDLHLFYREPGWRMDWHDHDFYQMILICDGVLQLQVNGRTYALSAGQLCLIPPGLPHMLETPLGYHQLGINLQSAPDSRGMIALLKEHFTDFRIFDRMQWLAGRPDLAAECCSLALLSKMRTAHRMDELILSCLEEPRTDAVLSPFRAELLQLLNASINQRITLDRLSRQLSVSSSHLERLCRREFGCSVIELYNRIRMNEACLQLAGSVQSLESIACSLGFYDPAHFSRFFKQRMKISPLQYRRQYRS
ncbi:MAG: AraC family transcriptional regulator [Paenibacillaceae bacterium]|nr:AraC family transcriptional regulator [Paenibacillaceae bacterium]